MVPNAEVRRSILALSAILFGTIVLWYLLDHVVSNPGNMGSTLQESRNYETVLGFFLQDDPETDGKTFNYTKHNFGLIDRTYGGDEEGDERLTQWQRFDKYIRLLVRSCHTDTTYKVVYLGRHGEGYHNLGEAKYGTKAWDDYWSKLDGDGELFWFDAHLTDAGKDQARNNHAFFKRQFDEVRMPAPEKYYTSPLYRCLQTVNLTYSGLDVPKERAFQPVVKELMREVMGEHTCDRRSTRSVIHKAEPDWEIEPGFTEEDELWQADHRETWNEHDARTQELLDDIFEHDQHIFLSFTSHSGAIASMLRVIGHRQLKVPTGGMMPILIKGTKKT